MMIFVTILALLTSGVQAICSNYPPVNTYSNINAPEKTTIISFDVANQPTGSGHYVAQTSGVY